MSDVQAHGRRRTPFLAVHDVPGGDGPGALNDAFERVAGEARKRGIRAVVTFYSPDHRRAYTYFEDDTADEVRRTCEAAGLSVREVVHGAKLGARLLDDGLPPRE